MMGIGWIWSREIRIGVAVAIPKWPQNGRRLIAGSSASGGLRGNGVAADKHPEASLSTVGWPALNQGAKGAAQCYSSDQLDSCRYTHTYIYINMWCIHINMIMLGCIVEYAMADAWLGSIWVNFISPGQCACESWWSKKSYPFGCPVELSSPLNNLWNWTMSHYIVWHGTCPPIDPIYESIVSNFSCGLRAKIQCYPIAFISKKYATFSMASCLVKPNPLHGVGWWKIHCVKKAGQLWAMGIRVSLVIRPRLPIQWQFYGFDTIFRHTGDTQISDCWWCIPWIFPLMFPSTTSYPIKNR
jgi:hypothetical protein